MSKCSPRQQQYDNNFLKRKYFDILNVKYLTFYIFHRNGFWHLQSRFLPHSTLEDPQGMLEISPPQGHKTLGSLSSLISLLWVYTFILHLFSTPVPQCRKGIGITELKQFEFNYVK
jgi:hypothetical protein